MFGHLPQDFQYSTKSFATSFEGCIRNVRIDDGLIDFSQALLKSNVRSGCQSGQCTQNTCKNDGQCLGSLGSGFDCICTSSFAGTDCAQGWELHNACTCMHMHMHGHTHACTCTRMDMHMHAHAHACTCTCTCTSNTFYTYTTR